MPKDNLKAKIKDSRKEILVGKQECGNYKLEEGYNAKYYFVRLKDNASGKIEEMERDIAHITEKSKSLKRVYTEVVAFIENEKYNGFGAGYYALLDKTTSGHGLDELLHMQNHRQEKPSFNL